MAIVILLIDGSGFSKFYQFPRIHCYTLLAIIRGDECSKSVPSNPQTTPHSSFIIAFFSIVVAFLLRQTIAAAINRSAAGDRTAVTGRFSDALLHGYDVVSVSVMITAISGRCIKFRPLWEFHIQKLSVKNFRIMTILRRSSRAQVRIREKFLRIRQYTGR